MEDTPFSVGVDREMCQTAAVCLAYHIYELDDEGKAVLLTKNGQNSDNNDNPLRDGEGFVNISDLPNPDGRTPEELQAMVLESAKICPFNAIIVKAKDGTQIWPV
jgi:ferredoxin